MKVKVVQLVAVLALGLYSLPVGAQWQLGSRISNYSGVDGMSLNPAHNLASRQNWEFRLGGAHFFADNNYAFLENVNLLSLWRARNLDAALVERPDLAPGENPNDSLTFVVDYFAGRRKRYGSINLGVSGPGLMVKLESGHTFGFFSGVRIAGGGHNVPAGFSYFPYFNQKFFEPFAVEPFNGAVMAWAEVGLNYGFSVETYTGRMGFGLNVKYLGGLEAAYFRSEAEVDFTKLPDNDFTSNLGELRFGYTSSNLDPDNLGPVINGSGMGLDLGFTYIVDGYNDVPAWRIGASLLDIGSITFRDNANPQVVRTDSLIYVDADAYEFFDQLDDLPTVVRRFSEQALQDSLLSSAGNQFRIWTPTRLHASVDYAVDENLFVNGTIIQRLPFGDLAVPADNILAVTPRYETQWLEISMPIVLLNYDQVHLGLAARLGVFVIGSDNLFALIGNTDLSGTDFYFGIRVPGFRIETQDRIPSANRKRKRGKGPRCYNW